LGKKSTITVLEHPNGLLPNLYATFAGEGTRGENHGGLVPTWGGKWKKGKPQPQGEVGVLQPSFVRDLDTARRGERPKGMLQGKRGGPVVTSKGFCMGNDY